MPHILVDNLHYSSKGLSRVIGILKKAIFPYRHVNFKERASEHLLLNTEHEFPHLQNSSHHRHHEGGGIRSQTCQAPRGDSPVSAPLLLGTIEPPVPSASPSPPAPLPLSAPPTLSGPPSPTAYHQMMPSHYAMTPFQQPNPMAFMQQWLEYCRRYSYMPPLPPPPFPPHQPTTLSYPTPHSQ